MLTGPFRAERRHQGSPATVAWGLHGGRPKRRSHKRAFDDCSPAPWRSMVRANHIRFIPVMNVRTYRRMTPRSRERPTRRSGSSDQLPGDGVLPPVLCLLHPRVRLNDDIGISTAPAAPDLMRGPDPSDIVSRRVEIRARTSIPMRPGPGPRTTRPTRHLRPRAAFWRALFIRASRTSFAVAPQALGGCRTRELLE